MTTGQKLYQLRREKGYSQEEVAEYLNVARQTVSKWESDITIPNIEQVKQICKLFNISLAKFDDENRSEENESNKNYHYNNYSNYEYKSKLSIFGIPLIHVHFGRGLTKATGIIAIGNIARGIFCLGGVSIGIISLGGVSLSIIGFGGLVLSLLIGFGGVVVSPFALGGIAIGYFAAGGLSVGVYAYGGLAIGSELAYGGYASARVAIYDSGISGFEVISQQGTSIVESDQIIQTIQSLIPNIPNFIIGLLKFIFGVH